MYICLYPIYKNYNNKKCTDIFRFLRSEPHQLLICFLCICLLHSIVVIFGMLHRISIIKELKHEDTEWKYIEPIWEVYRILRKRLRRSVGQWCPWSKVLISNKNTFLADLRMISLSEINKLDKTTSKQNIRWLYIQMTNLMILKKLNGLGYIFQ